MLSTLVVLILLEIILYSAWVLSLWNLSIAESRRFKLPAYLNSILSNGMLLVALIIIWQIFKLNLDFGLILGSVSLFAAFSWVLGKLIKLPLLRDESRSYFFILVLIFSFRSFAYEPYQIPSTSMVPGLQIGDFVLVNKYAYGLRLPTAKNTFFEVSSPKRGDVAVFIPPHTLCNVKASESRPDLDSLPLSESQIFLTRFKRLQSNRCTSIGIKYVKRIIGIAGDKVDLIGYDLFINGEKVPQSIMSSNGGEQIIQETLDQQIYITKILGESLNQEYTWIIPEGHYLSLGDNRDNSLDSRAWGYVSEKRLVGRADFIWMHWPSFTSIPSFARNKSIH